MEFKGFLKNPKTLFVILALGLSLLYIFRALELTRSDFWAYFEGAKRVRHGLSPYSLGDPIPFKYLPLTAYFFIPWTFGTLKMGEVLFMIALLFSTFVLYRKFFIELGPKATFLILMCCFRFHNQDWINLQINSFLLLLFFYFFTARKQEQLTSSLALAFFISFKIVPAFLLLPLFGMKKWGELTLFFLFFVVLNFLPLYFIHSPTNPYQDWYHLLSVTTETPAPTGKNIQSIASMLWFYFQNHLGENSFKWTTLCIEGLVSSLVFISSLRVSTSDDEDKVLAASLFISVTLSPLGWKHNYVQALPLLYLWAKEKNWKRMFQFFIVMTAIPTLISLFSKTIADRSYILVLGALYFSASTLFEVKYSRSKNRDDTSPDPVLDSY